MTWILAARGRLQCDDDIHKGNRMFDVQGPPDKALEFTVRNRGWMGNAQATVHQCPACAARRLGAN